MGGSSKLMAVFSKNDLITADKLNQVLTTPTWSCASVRGTNTKEIYLHSGGSIKYGVTGIGYASASITIYKKENSSWVQKEVDSATGGTNGLGEPSANSKSGTYYVNAIGGDGLYKIVFYTDSYTYTTSSWSGSAAGQQVTVSSDAGGAVYAVGNAIKGDYLVLYDNPTNSGNRLQGTMLTADLLNSGRVTTITKL